MPRDGWTVLSALPLLRVLRRPMLSSGTSTWRWIDQGRSILGRMRMRVRACENSRYTSACQRTVRKSSQRLKETKSAPSLSAFCVMRGGISRSRCMYAGRHIQSVPAPPIIPACSPTSRYAPYSNGTSTDPLRLPYTVRRETFWRCGVGLPVSVFTFLPGANA